MTAVLELVFSKNPNAEIAKYMVKYMKNKFGFYGIMSI